MKPTEGGTQARIEEALRAFVDSYDAWEIAAALVSLTDVVIVPTSLLSELVDPDDCSFDHNGGCQTHGYISLQPGETCPVHDAKSILASRQEAAS